MNTSFKLVGPQWLCLLFCLTLLFGTACDTTSTTTNNDLNQVTTSNSNKNNSTTDKDNTDKDNNEVVTDNKPPKTDTIQWCDTLKRGEKQLVVVCFEKIGNGPIKADTVDIIQVIQDNSPIAQVLDSTINKKAAYKVAIIMPFMSKNFSPQPKREIPPYSMKAIEFYEGAMIALDSLKAEGVKLYVDVFDSMRDTNTVKSILAKPELQAADLIIGPIRTSNLRLVADFANAQQTPLVSPFNSRPDITSNNPYYLQVNPSFKVHSRTMIQQMFHIKTDKGVPEMPKNFLVLGKQTDSAQVAQLQEAYATHMNDYDTLLPQFLNSSATIKINFIKPFLTPEKFNIILLPSKDEGFVYNSMRELQSLLYKEGSERKWHHVAIVGLDRWKYFSRIDYEYYESLNLHLPSEFYVDKDKDVNRKFRQGYKTNYGIAPREFGYIGFDVMLYFGKMLHQYGTNFSAHLWKEKYQGRHTQFVMQPVFEKSEPLDGSEEATKPPMIRGFENQYLNFLKFEEYTLQKVNSQPNKNESPE